MRKIFLIASAAVAFAAVPGPAHAMDQTPSAPGGGHGSGGGGHTHYPGCGHDGGSNGGGGQTPGGSPTSVPEPGTIALLGGGILALGVARRVRRRR